jgi:hypothetical protein
VSLPAGSGGPLQYSAGGGGGAGGGGTYRSTHGEVAENAYMVSEYDEIEQNEIRYTSASFWAYGWFVFYSYPLLSSRLGCSSAVRQHSCLIA